MSGDLDFSAFSEDAFDPKEWVNTALQSQREANVTADAHASNIVLRLQMFIQVVNNELESTSMQVVQDMPRIIKSVDVVQQEVGHLKEKMGLVKRDIEKVERDTAQSMSLLVELDEVKSRMVATTSALQEADNWTTLSEDIDAAFESGDLKTISSTLLGMQRSLMVLSDCADFDQRKSRLAMLQDKFEALVKPRLEDAYTGHSLEQARECVVMLKDVNRESQIQETYIRCHKKRVLAGWAQLCADDALGLEAAVATFYSTLSNLYTQESAFCAELFEGASCVAEMLCRILDGREPSLEDVVASDLQHGADHLQRLISLYTLTEGFLADLGANDGGVVKACYKPFVRFQVNYKTLQTDALNETAAFTEPDESLGLDDTVTHIKDSVPAVFAALETSVTRCFALTRGLAIADLISCLDKFAGAYYDRISKCLPGLRGQTEKEAAAAYAESGDAEEWSQTRSVFRLIEACGAMIQQQNQFETALRKRADGKKEELLKNKLDYTDGSGEMQEVYHNCMRALKKRGPVLSGAAKKLAVLNNSVHSYAFATVLSPLKRKLADLGTKPEWKDDNTSGFSLSPLGYITQVGEQLLMLPQQLEPFLGDDSNAVTAAFRNSKLSESAGMVSEEGGVADEWLSVVAEGVMAMYADEILKIKKITANGSMQLSADIDYLRNVLQALDVSPAQKLVHINQLLSVEKAEFAAFANDVDPPLAKALKSMRSF